MIHDLSLAEQGVSNWEQFCDLARFWRMFLFLYKFLGHKKLHRAGELLCRRKQKGEEGVVGWVAVKEMLTGPKFVTYLHLDNNRQ